MKLKWLGVYGLMLLVLLALDAVWLGAVARGMYARELGHLLAPAVRWGAAALFYLLYVAGLLALVVAPGRAAPSAEVAWRGALFGLVAYATYDLTNLATLAGWPLSVTIVDLAWGAAITCATALAGRALARRIPFGRHGERSESPRRPG
jgi:uncharacterized membrane protein